MNYIVATYLFRFLGILLIIPAIFPNWFVNQFPGLADRRISWVFFIIGMVIYIVASIVYHIFNKRERARRQLELENLRKASNASPESKV